MKSKTNQYIFTLIALAICMSILEVLFNLREEVVSNSVETTWGFVFVILSILWAYYDAEKTEIEKPFDFGFLVYVFWPVAFPWYLIKTRGAEGVIVFLGFLALWIFPWVAGLVAYVYFA